MLKTIISVAAGILLAAIILLSGWVGYEKYKDYKRQEAIEEVNLSLKKMEKALSAVDLVYADANEKVRNCLKSAVKRHKVDVELLNIVKLTESFVAIDYEVLDQIFHAQCTIGYKSDDVVSFSVL